MVQDQKGAGDTASAVLDVAEELVQRRGFNGFSYAHIAAELGITKAALHYYFPSKADLGKRLIERYSDRFGAALAVIDAESTSAPDKLRAYCSIYKTVLDQHRMCLCGMLAADYDTLPQAMRSAVTRFFDQNQVWLSALLEAGRTEGTFDYPGSCQDRARSIVAGLEGAMLVARTYADGAVLDVVTETIVAECVGTRGATAPARS